MNIEHIINGRLKHQTNIKVLGDEFDIYSPTLDKLKNPAFIKNFYHRLNDEKRKRFLFVIGGKTNIRRTDQFFNSIVPREALYETAV